MWQPQTFQPSQPDAPQGWMPQSFQPSQAQQPIGNVQPNGEQGSPNVSVGNVNTGQNQQDVPIINQLQNWSNTPATADLSDLPQSGQGLNLLQKVGAGAQAIGRGLTASAENSIIKPTVGGVTDLMARYGGYRPANTDSGPNPDQLSMRELSALTMLSPTSVALQRNMALPTQNKSPIGNQIISAANPSTAIDKLKAAAMEPDEVNQAVNTSQAAKDVASKFYNRSSSSDATFSPEFSQDVLNQFKSLSKTTKGGKLTVGDTPLNGLIDRWENGVPDKNLTPITAEPLDMKNIQEMDEGLSDLIDGEWTDGKLSKQGQQLLAAQSKFRDMVNAQPGTDDLVKARLAWHQGAKMSDIERVITRADGTDNHATIIKNGMNKIYSNASKTRGYSDAELSALDDARKRGLVGGTLHVFGSRLGPLMGGAAGAVAGGPIGAILAAGTTHAASSGMRNMAEKLQMNKVNNLMDVLGQRVPEFAERSAPESSPPLQLTYEDKPFLTTPSGTTSVPPTMSFGQHLFGEGEGMPFQPGERQNIDIRSGNYQGMPLLSNEGQKSFLNAIMQDPSSGKYEGMKALIAKSRIPRSFADYLRDKK